MTLVVILLAIIAYYLYRIYRQKESEREVITNEKFEAERQARKKEELKDYPYLFGKIESNWLEVFAYAVERNTPLLNMAFMLYLQESTLIDYSDGSMKWDTLWDLTEELLEHLEKYHEGSKNEHLIAVCTYWQIASEAMGQLLKENPNTGSLSGDAHTSPIEGKKLEEIPFTNIEKIISLFPKKDNHPDKELSFRDEKGKFPRESKGSRLIRDRITV